ncbi:DUF4382 domain-containing protein [Halovivax limisalsi]|uniref:DUF4382 domain-containing protein n=1 Tax=Halovivax limisalsi TaxID=1453760 RepID=UPI001FFC3A7E|nr:DUF4382 domain-containing protein [Halovivax limisalsi]
MKRRTFLTGAATGTIALTAGCTAALDGSDANEPGTGSSGATERGTVRFYVSDEPNQIDDFERLDVTISQVAFKPAGDDADEGDEPDGGNETADEEDAHADAENSSTTDGENASPDDGSGDDDGSDGEGGSGAGEDDGKEDGDDGDDSTDRSGWETYDLDDPTVDLTQLKGPKATVLDELDVPAGEYVAVDLFVSNIHAVLTDGTETRVKLPSERLQIRTEFTVAADEELDFVYDVAPHKAGQSGKYILRPVISESGTDAEIEDVDAEPRADGGRPENGNRSSGGNRSDEGN